MDTAVAAASQAPSVYPFACPTSVSYLASDHLFANPRNQDRQVKEDYSKKPNTNGSAVTDGLLSLDLESAEGGGTRQQMQLIEQQVRPFHRILSVQQS